MSVQELFSNIRDSKNYNQCEEYVKNLEYFYNGSRLPQYKIERITNKLMEYCRERTYDNKIIYKTDSNDTICSSVKVLGDDTRNTMIISPVTPSLETPFPLIIFSSRF